MPLLKLFPKAIPVVNNTSGKATLQKMNQYFWQWNDWESSASFTEYWWNSETASHVVDSKNESRDKNIFAALNFFPFFQINLIHQVKGIRPFLTTWRVIPSLAEHFTSHSSWASVYAAVSVRGPTCLLWIMLVNKGTQWEILPNRDDWNEAVLWQYVLLSGKESKCQVISSWNCNFWWTERTCFRKRYPRFGDFLVTAEASPWESILSYWLVTYTAKIACLVSSSEWSSFTLGTAQIVISFRCKLNSHLWEIFLSLCPDYDQALAFHLLYEIFNAFALL